VILLSTTFWSAKEIQESAKAAEIRISSRNVSKYLQRLVEKKLIERAERGLYELPDRMFRAYIRTLPD
jgi:predicted transcriptional regulator